MADELEEQIVALVQKSLDDLDEVDLGEDGWLGVSFDEKAVIAALSLAYLESLKAASEELLYELYLAGYIVSPNMPENIVFALESPFVINYLEQRAAEMVRNINDGTKYYQRRILLSQRAKRLDRGRNSCKNSCRY